MSKTWQKIILIASICIYVAAYSLWSFLWPGFFYQALAVCQCLWMLFIQDIAPKGLRKIATIGVWFTINNLMDELFFDPKKLSWNEYLFAIIIVVVILKRKGNEQTRRL